MNKHRSLNRVIALTLACWPPIGMAEDSRQNDDASPTYHGFVDTGVFLNKSDNDTDLSGQADVFVPIYQDKQHLLFTDIRGALHGAPNKEGSIGLGYRQIVDDWWLFGVYGFFDIEQTAQDNTFYQASIGGEWKTEHWQVTAHGYLPLGEDTKAVQSWNVAETRVDPADPIYQNIWTQAGEEVAMSGFDSEVAYTISDDYPISFHLGGYYFAADGVDTVAGPRGRVVWKIANPFHMRDPFWQAILPEVRLEFQAQWDKPRGTDIYAGVRMRFAFGDNTALKGIQARMVDPIYRGEGVVSGRSQQTQWQRYDKSGGDAYRVLNFNDISQTSNISGADIIAVQGSVTVPQIDLQADQIITGGQYSFTNNNQAFAIQLGQAGELIAQSGDILNLASNNQIYHLTLTGGGISSSAVIKHPGLANTSFGDLVIDGVNIKDGRVALQLDGTGNDPATLTFTNNTIESSVGLLANTGMVDIRVLDSSLVVNKLSNNRFFGAADNGALLRLHNEAVSSTSSLTIAQVNDNFFAGIAGTASAMVFSNNAALGGTASMTVNSISNNKGYFVSGTSESAIRLENSSGGGIATMTINNLTYNSFAFDFANNNQGITVLANDSGGTNLLQINGMYGNEFSGNNSPVDGIRLTTQGGQNASIEVNVNDGGKTLGNANNTTVSESENPPGSIIVNPGG